MKFAQRLIPLSFAIVLFSGCASMEPSCDVKAAAAKQRESTNSLLKDLLTALTQHNQDFRDAVKISKETKKPEEPKKDDKKPAAKKG